MGNRIWVARIPGENVLPIGPWCEGARGPANVEADVMSLHSSFSRGQYFTLFSTHRFSAAPTDEERLVGI